MPCVDTCPSSLGDKLPLSSEGSQNASCRESLIVTFPLFLFLFCGLYCFVLSRRVSVNARAMSSMKALPTVSFRLHKDDTRTHVQLYARIHEALNDVIPYKWRSTADMNTVELLHGEVTGVQIEDALRRANLCGTASPGKHVHVSFRISRDARAENWPERCFVSTTRLYLKMFFTSVSAEDACVFKQQVRTQVSQMNFLGFDDEEDDVSSYNRQVWVSSMQNGEVCIGDVMREVGKCKLEASRESDGGLVPACVVSICLREDGCVLLPVGNWHTITFYSKGIK